MRGIIVNNENCIPGTYVSFEPGNKRTAIAFGEIASRCGDQNNRVNAKIMEIGAPN